MAFMDASARRGTIISTDDGQSQRMDKALSKAHSLGIMKPGFTRLNLAYFMPDEEVEYILSAVNIVANEGWKLLPQYAYDVEHGSWMHRSDKNVYKLMTLEDITYNYGNTFHMVVKGNINPRSEPKKIQSYSQLMSNAKDVLENAEKTGRQLYPFDEVTMKEYLPANLMPYVWWLEPQHAMLSLNSQTTKSLALMKVNSIPIKPRMHSGPFTANSLTAHKYPQVEQKDTLPGANEAVRPMYESHSPKDVASKDEHIPETPTIHVPDRVADWVNQISSNKSIRECLIHVVAFQVFVDMSYHTDTTQ